MKIAPKWNTKNNMATTLTTSTVISGGIKCPIHCATGNGKRARQNEKKALANINRIEAYYS